MNIKRCSKTLLYGFVIEVMVRYLKDLNNSILESRRNRCRPRKGSFMASIWDWVFSVFIGKPVAMFLMCTYVKCALSA